MLAIEPRTIFENAYDRMVEELGERDAPANVTPMRRRIVLATAEETTAGLMKDTRLKRIYDMIDVLGVRIEYCALPEDMDGEYIHEEKLIRIQFDLSTRVYRSTLPHESCHAIWGDIPSKFGPVDAKQ